VLAPSAPPSAQTVWRHASAAAPHAPNLAAVRRKWGFSGAVQNRPGKSSGPDQRSGWSGPLSWSGWRDLNPRPLAPKDRSSPEAVTVVPCLSKSRGQGDVGWRQIPAPDGRFPLPARSQNRTSLPDANRPIPGLHLGTVARDARHCHLPDGSGCHTAVQLGQQAASPEPRGAGSVLAHDSSPTTDNVPGGRQARTTSHRLTYRNSGQQRSSLVTPVVPLMALRSPQPPKGLYQSVSKTDGPTHPPLQTSHSNNSGTVRRAWTSAQRGPRRSLTGARWWPLGHLHRPSLAAPLMRQCPVRNVNAGSHGPTKRPLRVRSAPLDRALQVV
jgi:hypothetical protein